MDQSDVSIVRWSLSQTMLQKYGSYQFGILVTSVRLPIVSVHELNGTLIHRESFVNSRRHAGLFWRPLFNLRVLSGCLQTHC